MSLPIRPATPDEFPALERAMGLAFGGDPVLADSEHGRAITEFDRTRCAYDGEEIVGTSGAISLELAVPGATLPAAGTTMVSVRSTHRRRGLLRAMMRSHFEDVREREEPLAALWASESSIYARFGYGPAAEMCSITVEPARARFARPLEAPGRCRLVGSDEAGKVLPAVYDAGWRERPGHFARSAAWWEHRHLYDPEHQRDGASSYRFAIYEESGAPRGFIKYRTRQKWPPTGLPGNELQVVELQGLDATARAALWRHALDVDLVAEVQAWNCPADCELPWLLADSRRALRTVRDSLWLRVLDVKRALESRRYAVEQDFVLALADDDWPDAAGSWRLETGPEGAACTRTTQEPDIRLAATDLGTVYMGGHRIGALARAGRVEGTAEAIARADVAFSWDPAPWCPEIF
ncbi:MAG: GNAT family N-acetyltransferase [Deltaproteobacteria bacterium]|nr:GNAT family N-acetyltransferase [Deltaproteobacteria bacterium]